MRAPGAPITLHTFAPCNRAFVPPTPADECHATGLVGATGRGTGEAALSRVVQVLQGPGACSTGAASFPAAGDARAADEHWGVQGQVDIINSTLGKALGGATGGYTTGRKEVRGVSSWWPRENTAT